MINCSELLYCLCFFQYLRLCSNFSLIFFNFEVEALSLVEGLREAGRSCLFLESGRFQSLEIVHFSF
jgi:hypothetical protein